MSRKLEEWIGTREAAAIVGTSLRMMQHHIKAGLCGPVRRVGLSSLIRSKDVLSFAKSRKSR